jgi:hypothetical protein
LKIAKRFTTKREKCMRWCVDNQGGFPDRFI